MLPDEAAFWTQFKNTAAEVFGRYGYAPIETPLFEQTELFVRGIGEATDVVSKEMFTAISGQNLATLMDGGSIKAKSRLSLRPEGTAGVVRAVVQHDLVPQGAAPAKLMYAGQMFRAERPQKGRQRQFNQIGIECLGAEDPIMLMRFYEAIGIPVEATRLLVNSMGCEQCRPAYRDAVKSFMDEHADELCDECARRAELNPLRAFDCKNPGCAAVMENAPKITDHLCDDCREHYEAVKTYLSGAGLAFVEDSKLVRGLDYYTKTVFEIVTPAAADATTNWPRKWAGATRRASAGRSATSVACWRSRRRAARLRPRSAAICSWRAWTIRCARRRSRSCRRCVMRAWRPRWITSTAA